MEEKVTYLKMEAINKFDKLKTKNIFTI